MNHRQLETTAFIHKAEAVHIQMLDYMPHHQESKDELPTWIPRILRLPALSGMVVATLLIVGLLEVAARKLPRVEPQRTDSTHSGSPNNRSVRLRRQAQAAFSPMVTSTYACATASPVSGYQTLTAAKSMYAQDFAVMYTLSASDIALPTVTAPSSEYAQDITVMYFLSASDLPTLPESRPPSVYAQDTAGLYTPTMPRSPVSTRAHFDHNGDEDGLYTPPPPTMSHEAYPKNPLPDVTLTPTSYAIAPSSYAKDRTMPYRLTNPAETSISSRKYMTLTTTYVALHNKDNPNYNRDLMPSYTATNDFTTVYSIVVTYPVWASVISSLVPVAVVAIYKGIWSAFYASVKLMEPFILLSAPGGAPARGVLFSYYTSTAALNPLVALQNGHWLMIWTSVVYLASGMFAPLASETLMTNTHSCPEAINAESKEPNPCLGQLMVDFRAVRALQGLLVFAGIMVGFSTSKKLPHANIASKLLSLALMLRRLKVSGVHNNPSSMVGIASLVHHPEVVSDFISVDGEASNKAISLHLAGKRYRLGSYHSDEGAYRYGFLPVATVSNTDWRPDHSAESSSKTCRNGPIIQACHHDFPADRQVPPIRKAPANKQDIAIDMGLWCLSLGLFAVITAYYFEGSNSGFNHFFNSDRFGPRFILTLFGAIIAAVWKMIYFEVSLKSAYAALAANPSAGVDARQSICKTQATLPFTGMLAALRTRHYFEAFIGFVAVLGEVLIIALPGIPLTSGEPLWQFYICSYTSLSILGIMILAVPALVLWQIKKVPYLPRRPDTIAGVISYVVAAGPHSALLRDADGTECMSTGERDAVLQGLNKRWCYRKMNDMDGKARWGVDEITDE